MHVVEADEEAVEDGVDVDADGQDEDRTGEQPSEEVWLILGFELLDLLSEHLLLQCCYRRIFCWRCLHGDRS